MRYFVLCLFLLQIVSISAQQEQIEVVEDTTIYIEVDVSAQFLGGRSEFLRYISSCVVIPRIAYDMGIMIPKQVVEFVVCADGMITEVKLLKGTPDCPECDEAVVKCFRQMPDWIPAKQEGKSVNSKVVIPINICLR